MQCDILDWILEQQKQKKKKKKDISGKTGTLSNTWITVYNNRL